MQWVTRQQYPQRRRGPVDNSTALTTSGSATLVRPTEHRTEDVTADAPVEHSPAEDHHPLIIHLPPLKPAIFNAARLLAETAIVPTLLFGLVLHGFGLGAALIASLCWAYFVIGMHAVRARRVPGTLLLCAGMVTTRTAASLLTSSAFIYLVQPVIGSICMAAFFLGSAFVGKPITVRLARDFVHIPSHLVARGRVQRMFRDVALLWGASRVVSAGLSLGMMHSGLNAALMARGIIAPVLTVVSVLACAAWGWRCLSQDGVCLRRAPVASALAI
jgi:hypothetical protein